MGLKATRKLLSVILAVIVAASTVIMLASFVAGSTFATQGYLTKHLISDELADECEAQLNMKFDALEIKSGVPARVFEIVEQDYNTKESLSLAVQYLFTDESSTLYNQDKVDYFYNLCVEYLDGNNISYDKASVQNTAEEAAQIYSDCVGIHNADTIKDYLSVFSRSCARAGSAALVIIVASVILLNMIYKTKEKAYLYTAGGAAGGALASAIGAVLCMITKVGSDFDFEPAVYQQSFYSMTGRYFIILLIVSIAFLAVIYASAAAVIKKQNKDNARKETRFTKIIGKF